MNGHIEVLQWARAQGCPWDEKTCSVAAINGHRAVLQWIWKGQVENAQAAPRAPEVVPPSFSCPITQERMKDPAIAADGHSYERAAIARWLRQSGTGPSTNLQLEHREVTPNHSLRSAILDFGQQRTDAFVNV